MPRPFMFICKVIYAKFYYIIILHLWVHACGGILYKYNSSEIKRKDKELRELRVIYENDHFLKKITCTLSSANSSNTAFLTHCAKNKIDFVAPAPISGAVYTTPNTMPWVLLGSKGRANRSWVEDPKFLTAFTFTLQALRASPYNTTLNYLAEGLFIFIAVPGLRLFCAKLRDCGTCIHPSTAFFNLPPDVRLMF
ncbi:hypothetical protein B0H10DRAFT_1962633 [Mycena sp. CBHHK59/15]|nr:hypothetical protein B0H10DRAFT_1962633 [Mycena sp. CBHHK59/15]